MDIHSSSLIAARDNTVHNTSHIHNHMYLSQANAGQGSDAGTRSSLTEHPSQTYSRLLLSKGRGFPLFDPEPPSELPVEYKAEGVRIGDVGIVHEDGFFDFLFNICLPASHPINSFNSVPDGFVPLPLTRRAWAFYSRIHEPGSYEAKGSIESPSERITSEGEYQFLGKAGEGAVLVLPNATKEHKLKRVKDFRDYAGEHAPSWYSFATDQLGWDAPNGSIYLITSWEKTSAWGTASFLECNDGFDLHFSNMNWTRVGLASTKSGLSNNNDTPLDNQCIFLKGFKVTLGETLLAKIRGTLLFSDVFENWQGYYGLISSILEEKKNLGSVTIESISGSSNKEIHPSSYINLYLLSKVPDARVAITHDDQWCSLIKDAEMPIFAPIDSKYGIAIANGVAFLEESLTAEDALYYDALNSRNHDEETPLLRAAKDGRGSIVERLLDEGVNVNEVDRDGRTALSWASERGDQLIVTLLLEHGHVEVDTKDKNGQTPFLLVTKNGRIMVLTLLLEYGDVEVDSEDHEGRTPFSHAAQNGQESVIKLLLGDGGVRVNRRSNTGRTPLSYAVENDESTVVKLLLEHGDVEADSKDIGGRTPLSWAAASGQASSLKLLLEHGGVEVDSKDKNGRTPFSYAAEGGRESVIKLLLERGCVDVDSKDSTGRTPLSYAIENHKTSTVRLLLDHGGVEVNLKNNDGRSLFSFAAQRGQNPIVELMLRHGAIDVDSRDNNGRTPFSYASEKGKESIIKLLLEHGGVDVNSQDNTGRTPLLYAVQNGWRSIAKLLLEHGVNVDLKDSSGLNALWYTLQADDGPTMKLMIAHGGVALDSRNHDGSTPFWYAVREYNVSTIKALLEHKEIDVNTKDADGLTPLAYLVANGPELVVKILLGHEGVKVDTRDKKGFTPLAYASLRGRESIVKLLLDHADVNVDSRDNTGRTPLSYAAENGAESIVKHLLAHGGVDVDSKDNTGRTPLSYAAAAGRAKVKRLLEPHSKDSKPRFLT